MDTSEVIVLSNSSIKENVYDDMKSVFIISSIFAILWISVGVAAFIMSLICFGRSGTTAQHVIGLLLAIFFGPFYWIYYFVVSSYCRKSVVKTKKIVR